MWTCIISLHTYHESQPLMYSQNESFRGNQEESNLTGDHVPTPPGMEDGVPPFTAQPPPQSFVLCFKDCGWALDFFVGGGKNVLLLKSQKQNKRQKNQSFQVTISSFIKIQQTRTPTCRTPPVHGSRGGALS